MSDRLKALREERANIVTQMRAITDGASAAKRDLTDEEVAQHGKLFDEQQKRANLISVEERQIEAERSLADRAGEAEERRRSENPGASANPFAAPEYRAAFVSFMKSGRDRLAPEEARALSVGIGSQGGYMIAPEMFASEMIKFVDNALIIRQLATTMQIQGYASLGAASLDADPADPTWTSELSTGSEDTTMAFGKRKMVPSPLAQRIKVSNDLLRQVNNIESLVIARLGYKIAVVQESAFMTGNGANQPLGIFTASADGITTGRDVSTGNTTSSPTFDGLTAAKYALKAPYRKSKAARWVFSRDALAKIALLKDTTNQYLWQPSQVVTEPDMILGIPLLESEYVPNTFTTGLYVGALGDFSNYWIVDSLSTEIRRLDELYAETAQTGFISRSFTDGQPVLAEAFVRVKLG